MNPAFYMYAFACLINSLSVAMNGKLTVFEKLNIITCFSVGALFIFLK